MTNQTALIRAMLAREATTIDPEFKRSAQAYATKHGSQIGVFRNDRNVMFWQETRLAPEMAYFWTTV